MKESGIDSQKIIRRTRDGELEYQPDDLTIEEPLEIRIGRKALATTMRTPGHDEELAAGFLVSEAIVHKREEMAKISASRDNIVIVDLAAGLKAKLGTARRFGTIQAVAEFVADQHRAIRQNFLRLDRQQSDRSENVARAAGVVAKHQGDFARTGGIHAAGIFNSAGDLKRREDIGRHNAVDKAIGRAFLDGLLPLDRHLLLVMDAPLSRSCRKRWPQGFDRSRRLSAFDTARKLCARKQPTLIVFLRRRRSTSTRTSSA